METTDRYKQVLIYAEEEAQKMGHQKIGTHHLLIAILRENKGIGMVALSGLLPTIKDITPNLLREEIKGLIPEWLAPTSKKENLPT